MKNIPLFKVHMPKTVMAPLKKVLMSGYIGQGPKVDEFEEKLSKWMSNKNILTTNSCTSAIHLALRLSMVDY
jgi:dTDP-4-amino-4,6-dideoxygalactose transaminase